MTPGTSNPVRGRVSFGGVARNVAETLARLRADVGLLTAVGDDAAGKALMAACRDVGIDMERCIVGTGAPTGEYIAAFFDGNLVVAFADMAILDQLTPDVVGLAVAGTPPEMLIFADCNLPVDSIAALCQRAARDSRFLALDAVSVAKSTRLPEKLAGVSVLFCNLDEARVMTGEPDPEKSIAVLLGRGAASVAMTLAREGVLLADAGNLIRLVAPGLPVANVSGAGDALVAGTLLGVIEGKPLQLAVRFGMACAALAVQSEDTVPAGLTRVALDQMLAAMDPILIKEPRDVA